MNLQILLLFLLFPLLAQAQQEELPVPGQNLFVNKIAAQQSYGPTLLGDTVTVYLAGEKDWFVFPNPVHLGEDLQVLSDTEEEAHFVLFDILWKTILERILDDKRVAVPLTGIPRGVHFSKIMAGNVFYGGRKLMLE